MIVHCKACNHEWDRVVPLPSAIPRFTTLAREADAAGCPSCKAQGEGTLLVGPARRVTATKEATHER